MRAMIRPARLEDVDAIVAMGLRFQAETDYAQHLRANPEALRTLAVGLITSEVGTIFVAEREGSVIGMLAAATYVHPMSGELVAHELCWWMRPGARGDRTALALVREAERWAVSRGAAVFQMVAPTDRVGAFYEALRYAPVERLYQRRLA